MLEKAAENKGKISKTHDTGGTILLIDDEQLIRSSTKRLLERLGYKVYVADDGPEAIALFHEKKEEIDLVVLDLIMPGMTGEEVFQHLQKIDSKVRIILSSGYSQDENTDDLFAQGAAGYLEKPFDLQTLLSELARVQDLPTA